MATEKDLDPHLEAALDLLRSALGGSSTATPAQPRPAESINPWPMPLVPPPSFDGRMSATDLLNGWFRPTSGMADPWEDFFSRPPQPAAPHMPGVAVWAAAPTTRATHGAMAAPVAPAAGATNWTEVRSLFALESAEDHLDDAHAQAVVDCLYDYVHAIGSRDVDAAMDLVADDYHVLAGDVETDRAGLRRELEALVDSLSGWEFDIALTQIPTPLPHPYGVLVYAEIGVDAHHARDGLWRSFVRRQVALFEHQPDGAREWKLAALSPA